MPLPLQSPVQSPLVSVLMPVRNGQATLDLALRSIRGQTYANWELLLIDDGSSDRSVAIARALGDARIRVFEDGQWLGLAPRLNEGIDAAQGRYIARLDADDVAYPERLAAQVDFLEKHPSVDLLGSSAVVFDDAGRALGRFPAPITHSEICRRPWSGFHLPHPTWMGRTQWFRRHRYRSEMNRGAEDQDLLLRSHRTSGFANLPDPLIGYRQDQLSWRKFASGRFQWARAALHEARLRRAYGAIASVISMQTAKGLYETAAITSGLGRRLLRHRAGPISAADVHRWNSVWRALHS